MTGRKVKSPAAEAGAPRGRVPVAVFLLLSLCALCTVGFTGSFDPQRRLVVAPFERRSLAEAELVLDRLFAAGKPVLVYVHGRGDEPAKSRDQRILETLERNYGVKVLMVGWDSRGILTWRPVSKARAAAPLLVEVVKRMLAYRQAHAAAAKVPVSLLVHSMGNIVFRSAVEAGLPFAGSDGPLFTNVLMTSSDEDTDGHRLWVEKIKARGTVMITVNRGDRVLAWSRHDHGGPPLGVAVRPPLASNACYLDVTGLVGGEHRLFAPAKKAVSPVVAGVIGSMLRGEVPELPAGERVVRMEPGRVLVPRARPAEKAARPAGHLPATAGLGTPR